MIRISRHILHRIPVLGGLLLLLAITTPVQAAGGSRSDIPSLRNAGYLAAADYQEIIKPEAAAPTTVTAAGAVENEATVDEPTEVAILPVYSLREIVRAAVEHSPGLAAMQWQAISGFEQSNSIAGYGGLRSEFSITGIHTNSPLGVFASRLSQGRVTQMDFDPATLNDPDYLGNLEYKLMLMYPLFESGRIGLLSDAVALNANAIDFDALGREHELTGKVIEAYFNHALLTDQLAVLDDAQLTVTELKRLIEQLYEEGLVIGSDVAAADVQLANLADEINRATAYRHLIEDTLGIMTGGRYTGEFTAEVPVDLAGLPVPELAEITLVALETRPDLQAMHLRVCAATNVLDEAIKKRNPTVGVFAEGKRSTPGIWENGHNEVTVGAQLLLDLDTGGVINNEIDQKRADLEAAKLGLKQLAELAEIDVAMAHAEVAITKQSISTFSAQAERSCENLRVVRNRYREGLTNYLDLRMAITQHKESRLRQVKARHDYLLAYLQLLISAGQTGGSTDPFLGDVDTQSQGYQAAVPEVDCQGGENE